MIILTKTPNLIGGQVVHFCLTTYPEVMQVRTFSSMPSIACWRTPETSKHLRA